MRSKFFRNFLTEHVLILPESLKTKAANGNYILNICSHSVSRSWEKVMCSAQKKYPCYHRPKQLETCVIQEDFGKN